MARSFESYEDYKRHLRNKYGQGKEVDINLGSQ